MHVFLLSVLFGDDASVDQAVDGIEELSARHLNLVALTRTLKQKTDVNDGLKCKSAPA